MNSKTRWNAERMFPLLKDHLAVGGDRVRFCEEHAISEFQYRYWLRRYRQHQEPPSDDFIEITPAALGSRAWMEVAYPDGRCVRMFTPLPSSYVVSLLRASAP